LIREKCSVTEDVLNKIEKNMLRWFGHVRRMDEKGLTKESYDYEADLDGNAVRRKHKRTYLDQIENVLEKCPSQEWSKLASMYVCMFSNWRMLKK
jgi:hypothetical protein